MYCRTNSKGRQSYLAIGCWKAKMSNKHAHYLISSTLRCWSTITITIIINNITNTQVLEQAEEEDFGMSALGQVEIYWEREEKCEEYWENSEILRIIEYLASEEKLSQIRSCLWRTIEYPWTSSLAQFLACFSLFMVMCNQNGLVISKLLH